MVRKKKAEEYEAKIKQALAVLGEVSEDRQRPGTSGVPQKTP